ncbi:MAG: trypsin-like peptidase domain-containing protein, partial [Rhodoglobus sp.]
AEVVAATTPTEPDQQPGAGRPKRSAPVALVAALAVGAVIGGASGAGVTMWATSTNAPASVVTNSSPSTITVNDPANANQVTAVAAKASPSVVTIGVSSDTAGGTGSGVILDTEGHVLTNAHVITLEGATANPTIQVTSYDGHLYAATVVGIDAISDLAVIKLTDATGLVPAEFADSSALNVGDTAIMIGAPLGLSSSVSDGIVSALNRSITVASSAVPDSTDTTTPAPNGENPFDLWNFDVPGGSTTPTTSSTISLSVLQTNAGINPGSSGGALVDDQGRVIGINVAIATTSSSGQSGSIGIGFAIPSNLAQRIAGELIATGTATHGLLGASVTDVTEDSTQADSKVIGASIVEISAGGAAHIAGLKVGDVITQIDGLPVTGKTDLTAQVRSLAGGAKSTLSYVRDGKSATVTVTLGTLG